MPYYRCAACGVLSHSVAGHSSVGVCANCSSALPHHASFHIVSESLPPVGRTIRAGLAAPAQARDAVSALPVGELARERLALMVSELTTNSLRHAGLAAGDPIELQVTSDNGNLWVSVRDGGPGFTPPEHGPRSNGAGGFGLAIVAALADRWGVKSSPNGCTVWCALTVAKLDAVAPDTAVSFERRSGIAE